MSSEYFTTTLEMKASVEVVAAATGGNYVSFHVPVHGFVVPVEVEQPVFQYQEKGIICYDSIPGGLGQFGVIARARIALELASKRRGENWCRYCLQLELIHLLKIHRMGGQLCILVDRHKNEVLIEGFDFLLNPCGASSLHLFLLYSSSFYSRKLGILPESRVRLVTSGRSVTDS